MIGMVVRTAFSLFAVLVLMFILARVARRGVRRNGGGTVEVLARQQLSRGSSVALVRVGGRPLLLGVTDAGVSLLTELSTESLQQTESSEQPAEVSVVGRVPMPRSSGDTAQRPIGALAGSVLSPGTWRTAIDVLRERTVRKSAA